ncbi:hypothetical protein UFOVP155_13 [uncultured Caudovirales phage]|uniref:Uncharacterized protein n=1 Tax=uncultured Caudovirales phage TaxID=2100421 RepID=A0A6J7W8C1_9CAUD|nr:hypothetical protein UFOVP155_13 [uncultured Caudovirales phage]
MIPLLFTPMGRYIAIALLILSISGGVYYKIRSDAVQEMETAANEEVLRRTINALRSSGSIAGNPERLRELDQEYCRDC